MLTRPPLSLDEAAAYLNVKPRYMRRLVEQRRVPVLRFGRLLRFNVADLDAFIEKSRAESA